MFQFDHRHRVPLEVLMHLSQVGWNPVKMEAAGSENLDLPQTRQVESDGR